MNQFDGTITQTYIVYNDDGREPYEYSVDITRQVQLIAEQGEKHKAQVAALQQDLKDIKSRRYWDEVTLVTNEKTGMTVALRTTYRWQAENLSLHITPEMLQYGSVGLSG